MEIGELNVEELRFRAARRVGLGCSKLQVRVGASSDTDKPLRIEKTNGSELHFPKPIRRYSGSWVPLCSYESSRLRIARM